MRVFLTGAAGDLGSRLRPALTEAGIGFTAMDRTPAGNAPNALRGDLIDAPLHEWLVGHDAVIHLAALPGDASPSDTFRSNVFGAWRVLSEAANVGIKRLVLTSSAPVHLDQSTAGLANSPLLTGSDGDRVYDVSKRLQESLAEDVARHGRAERVTVICLRLGHVVDGAGRVDFEGRDLARLDYCRGGWVDVADVTRALVRSVQVEAQPGFHLHHVIGDGAARERYGIDAAEAFLGMTVDDRFEAYRPGQAR